MKQRDFGPASRLLFGSAHETFDDQEGLAIFGHARKLQSELACFILDKANGAIHS